MAQVQCVPIIEGTMYDIHMHIKVGRITVVMFNRTEFPILLRFFRRVLHAKKNSRLEYIASNIFLPK